MKFQVAVLLAVVCIVLAYSSPVESLKKKVYISKTIERPVYSTAVYKGPMVHFPKKFWKTKSSSANWRPVVAPVAPVQWVPIKTPIVKYVRPVQAVQWQPRPAVVVSGTKGLSKTHWLSKRAPGVKGVPCRTTERPFLKPALVASQPTKLPATLAPVVAAQAPLASVAALQTTKYVAPESSMVAQQAPLVASAKAEPLVTPVVTKFSFVNEPERSINYNEGMEPEP